MAVNPIITGGGGGGGGGGFTGNLGAGTYTALSSSSSSWMTSDINYKPIISLHGEEADVVINGKSLKDSIAGIEARLAILTPNPELEARWDRLRELREEYLKVEAEIKEKELVWSKLK